MAVRKTCYLAECILETFKHFWLSRGFYRKSLAQFFLWAALKVADSHIIQSHQKLVFVANS